MEPNPYQSPVIPKDGQGPKEPDSATALLAEMRDMQREMLKLSRSNATLNRYAMYGILGLILVGALCVVAISGVMVVRIMRL